MLFEQRDNLASLGLLAIVLDGPGAHAIAIERKTPERFQFSPLDIQRYVMDELRRAGTRQDVIERDGSHVYRGRTRRCLVPFA